MLYRILPQTPYNFSYLVAATQDVVVGDRIPVSKGKTVNVSVRIHRLNLSAGASFQFLVYGQNPSRTDGANFLTSATIGTVSAFTTASPNLVSLAAVISEPVHPYVQVVLRATGPSAPGNVYGELSADVVVRGNECGCGGARGRELDLAGGPRGGTRDKCYCLDPNGSGGYTVPCGAEGDVIKCFKEWISGRCKSGYHPEFGGSNVGWQCHPDGGAAADRPIGAG
jgi:hypothetical protein